ncbi:MAG: SurA N-terminal domain-containing protein [Candidatus Manganitrophus sp.]|nr:MAG: SurA N-terminal domain-containing protein [Candidatus Manganitrophus sp.]
MRREEIGIGREKSEFRTGKLLKLFFWILSSGFCLLFLPRVLLADDAAPVAEVNQVPITADSVEEGVRNYLRQIGHKELSPPRMMSLRKEVLGRLIDEELIYQEALKQGEKIAPEEIEAEVDRIRKRFAAEDDFNAALVREGLTLEEVRQGVRRFILVRKMWNEISPSDEAGKKNWLEGVRKKSEIKIY